MSEGTLEDSHTRKEPEAMSLISRHHPGSRTVLGFSKEMEPPSIS